MDGQQVPAGQRTTVHGAAIWHRLKGPSAGDRIVVQGPGWGLGSGCLELAMAPLEAEFRVLYHDTRGTGRSAPGVDSATLNAGQMAADTEALASALGWQTYRLLGYSHGAYIALDHALRYPRRVERLVLVSPMTSPADQAESLLAALDLVATDPARLDARAAWLEVLAGNRAGNLSAVWRRMLPLYVRHLANLAPDQQQLAPAVLPLPVYETVTATNPDYDHRDRWHEIGAPALVVVGADDLITPASRAEALCQAMPNARLAILPDCGHFPWIEAPGPFYEAIERFLKASLPRR